jgi:hypothetical protein
MDNMAKANRKRANDFKEKESAVENKPPEKEKTIYDDFTAKTLSQDDANRMKEIFTLSNNVSALIRDYAEKQIAVKHMRGMAKQIIAEHQPLMIQVAKNMYKTEKNFQLVSNDILKQADEIEKSLIIIHGQIEHRYEDYISALIRHKRFIEEVISMAGNKVITGHRGTDETRAEEEKLFEEEFNATLKKE